MWRQCSGRYDAYDDTLSRSPTFFVSTIMFESQLAVGSDGHGHKSLSNACILASLSGQALFDTPLPHQS